jgi:uncharacterized membrane protein
MASKINTYMSVPLLFFMGAGSEGHYPIFNYYTLVLVIVGGFALVKFAYGFSKNIKGM